MAILHAALLQEATYYAFGILIASLIYWLYRDTQKPKNFPPGPRWYPVVGSMLLVRKLRNKYGYLHNVWNEFTRQYGPIVGLRLGYEKCLVVSGYDAVKDGSQNPDLEGRPHGFYFRLRTFGEDLGLVLSDGTLWQEQRKFTMSQLAELGLGKSRMKDIVEMEAEAIMKLLRDKSEQNKPIPMTHAFDISVMNTLWSILGGKRFDLGDARLAHILTALHGLFRDTDGSGGLLNHAPFLRFICPELCGYNNNLRQLGTVFPFIREVIAEHRRSYTPGSPRDLVDAFLAEMEARKHMKDTTFHEKQLMSLLLDMLMAGAETTSGSLGFAVLFLVDHPEIQTRVQQEIDDVIGDRMPNLNDRPQMKYLEAVILETLRMGIVAPTGVPRRATKDTYIKNMFVAENTTVLFHLRSVHFDPTIWDEPYKFKPERFLDKDNNINSNTKYLFAFGFGKRRCPGEGLSRCNLFLLLASLFQQFTVVPDPNAPVGDPIANKHYIEGFSISPKSFTAVLKPRKKV